MKRERIGTSVNGLSVSAAALAVVLVVAGCSEGGSGVELSARARTHASSTAEPLAVVARGPGPTLARFVDASRFGDAKEMWRLLSHPSRARLGPSLVDFRSRAAGELQRTLGAFVEGYELVVAEQITHEFAVAAVAGERAVGRRREYGVYAAALRRERGRWYLELRGAVHLRAIRPTPGERVRQRTQLAAAIATGTPIQEAGLWFDGVAFPSRGGRTDAKHLLMFGEAPPLTNGRHVVVGFASTADSAAALGWSFSVRGGSPR